MNVTQEELDWFVEGELDHQERDELFARLDEDVDGWKRCALALLEQQALCKAMSHNDVADCSAGRNHSGSGKPVAITKPLRPASLTRMGVAAMLCVALISVGYWLGENQTPQSAGRPALSMDDSLPPEHPVLSRLADQDPAVRLRVGQAIEQVAVADSTILALVSMELNNEHFVLPLIESQTLSKQITELPPLAMPPNLSRKLAKSGYKVLPRRQFVSVNHEDGTSEVLPLNMLDFQYVGKSVF